MRVFPVINWMHRWLTSQTQEHTMAPHIRRTHILVVGTFLALAAACNDPPPAPEITTSSSDVPVADAAGDSKGGPTVDFADLRLTLEFNSTDNDLGVQLNLDAVGWERVTAFDPGGNQFFQISGQGRLKQLGLTELFFETAEPSPAEVIALIPQGNYRFTGTTVDGEALAGTARLSHALPSAPTFISPTNGQVVNRNNLVIRWQPISGLARFQLIVENDETGETLIADLLPTVTSLAIPAAFLVPNTTHKAEVLAIGKNGNKTLSEITFVTGGT